MKHTAIFLVIIFFAIQGFSQTNENFDIQGHRGCRGLLPENTIPSFLKALDLGVDTLELDVVISKDNRVVVSHEPWFSSVISLDPQGKPIPAERQKEINIYQMNYSEIKKYDVGSIGNKDFPEQQKMKVFKPLLGDVFKAVKKHLKQNKLKPVKFNIEIKSTVNGDDLYHPKIAVFTKLVYDEILAHKMEKLSNIQSFDVRPLQELKKYSVKIPIAFLVSNKDGVEKNLEKLGFKPEIYSPHFSLVNQELVDYCQTSGIKIIPWTVNEISDFENMKKFKLDGIITDYPDRAIKIFR